MNYGIANKPHVDDTDFLVVVETSIENCFRALLSIESASGTQDAFFIDFRLLKIGRTFSETLHALSHKGWRIVQIVPMKVVF